MSRMHNFLPAGYIVTEPAGYIVTDCFVDKSEDCGKLMENDKMSLRKGRGKIMLHLITSYFEELVEYCVIILEFIGLIVLMLSALKNVWGLFRKAHHVRLSLAEGIALALEFKLGSEVLRTVIVRQSSELVILGAIILMRAALTFLIHWEIRNEKMVSAQNQADSHKIVTTHNI